MNFTTAVLLPRCVAAEDAVLYLVILVSGYCLYLEQAHDLFWDSYGHLHGVPLKQDVHHGLAGRLCGFPPESLGPALHLHANGCHLKHLAEHMQASYPSSEAAMLLCISWATGYHSSG